VLLPRVLSRRPSVEELEHGFADLVGCWDYCSGSCSGPDPTLGRLVGLVAAPEATGGSPATNNLRFCRSGNAEDNIRKTIGQLFGGIAVLIGAWIAYQQFIQQQQSSHDLLISNQVSKGFEQLGSNKPVVRLGGIYALEGVMNTSEQYRGPVLEALSAFVRDGTRTTTGDGPPATDIQAALTVIGRRKGFGIFGPDLSNSHIPKALLGAFNLRNVDLSGADLRGADLRAAGYFPALRRQIHAAWNRRPDRRRFAWCPTGFR
jgi:Pentapeptide repeats (8 copies)